ncbi:MAG: CoA-binding protein [Candidatus Bipolaricaulia bacterium]
MTVKTDEEIRKILSEARTVAVVGCSRDPEKDAHRVPRYLQEQGYKIIPVNPQAGEILGERAYPSLAELERRADIIEIFRPSEEAYRIVQEAIKLRPKAIWMQLGIVDEAAAKLAEEHGIEVVMDRCMMVEHRRLFGK